MTTTPKAAQAQQQTIPTSQVDEEKKETEHNADEQQDKKPDTAPAKRQLPIEQMTLEQLVKVAPMKAAIAAGMKQEDFAREASFAMQMLNENAYLAQCAMSNRVQLVEAIKTIALTKLTLNPELKLGYLVPRKGKIYFQSSYMGKREIILRAGIVVDLWVKLVYENDVFYVEEGTDPKLEHKPQVFGDRGEVIGGYWVAIYHDNRKRFGTMDRKRIDEIKKRSESVKAGKGSPWDSDPEEMMKKTIVNAAFKELPKSGISDDQLKIIEMESQLDKEDFKDWLQSTQEKKGALDDDGEPERLTFEDAITID